MAIVRIPAVGVVLRQSDHAAAAAAAEELVRCDVRPAMDGGFWGATLTN